MPFLCSCTIVLTPTTTETSYICHTEERKSSAAREKKKTLKGTYGSRILIFASQNIYSWEKVKGQSIHILRGYKSSPFTVDPCLTTETARKAQLLYSIWRL